MCKRSGELIDHLLLHCPIAQELWLLVFSLFRVQRVMPRGVMELLACCKVGLGWSRYLLIWQAVPHYLFWCLWRERNARCFEGQNARCWIKRDGSSYSIELMAALGLFSFSNIIDLPDSCA
jgi:hypothetical protein